MLVAVFRCLYSYIPKCIVVVFFFFQAEDGIRVRNVTGVQTCALPIYISDDEGLGRLYADELGTIDIPEHIQNYFDYEA